MAEGFGPQAMPNEVRSFQENARRLASEEANMRQAKAELAELKASGSASPDAIAAAAARALAASSEAENYRMILLRQKSIKGFYIPAKPGYVMKCAEVRALEEQLAQLEVGARA